MRKLDTRAKTVGKNKTIVKGGTLPMPVGVAERYRKKLQRITDQMTTATVRELTDLFKHPDVETYIAKVHQAVAMDISPASQARILTNRLRDKFEDLFRESAKPFAEEMYDEANATSQANMGMSLREISKHMSFDFSVTPDVMKEFEKAVVAENVRLIKSIPEEFFSKVQGEVLRSITTGKGLEDLDPFFKEMPGEQSRRSKNIAYDQTHKAYNGLNSIRMKQVGIKKFEWIHSGGGLHPREHHLDRAPAGLNGGIFSFDKLPIIDLNTGERGIPGQAVNCKCTQRPVVDMEAA